MDENLTYTINSEYYSLAEISKLNPLNESLSLFHQNIRSLSAHYDELTLLLSNVKFKFDVIGISNIRSLSAHYDELTLLLSNLKFKFDVIGISETKEQSDKGFLSNVGIPGYSIHYQPTNVFAGGVALDYKI